MLSTALVLSWIFMGRTGTVQVMRFSGTAPGISVDPLMQEGLGPFLPAYHVEGHERGVYPTSVNVRYRLPKTPTPDRMREWGSVVKGAVDAWGEIRSGELTPINAGGSLGVFNIPNDPYLRADNVRKIRAELTLPVRKGNITAKIEGIELFYDPREAVLVLMHLMEGRDRSALVEEVRYYHSGKAPLDTAVKAAMGILQVHSGETRVMPASGKIPELGGSISFH